MVKTVLGSLSLQVIGAGCEINKAWKLEFSFLLVPIYLVEIGLNNRVRWMYIISFTCNV
jgi:hypothetical protein